MPPSPRSCAGARAAEVAHRAVRVLARHVDAPAAALYYVDRDPSLKLLGKYALSATDADPTATFRIGEGLVGEAALRDEITIIKDPPADYLRIRSGLRRRCAEGDRALAHRATRQDAGGARARPFKSWTEPFAELLLSVRETLAIALESRWPAPRCATF